MRFLILLVSFFASAWRRVQKTELEKTLKCIGRASTFSMCAFLRAAPKREAEDKGGEKKRSLNRGEKGCRSNAKKTLKMIEIWAILATKIVPKRVRKRLPTPSWLQERVGRLLGSISEDFGIQNEAKTHPKLKRIFEAIWSDFCPPSKLTPPPRAGGARRCPHLVKVTFSWKWWILANITLFMGF